ncbi:MAG: hypothetical protein ACRC9Q_10030 [Bacteroidales bacterium]
MRKIILLLIILFRLSPVLFCQNSDPEKTIKSIRPDAFLTSERYSYYEDKLFLNFDVRFAKVLNTFSTVLLQAETAMDNSFFLMLDGGVRDRSMSLFLSKNMAIRKVIVPVDSSMLKNHVIPVYIEMDMRKDLLRCSLVPGDTVVFQQVGLSVEEGYQFSMPLKPIAEKQEVLPERGVAYSGLTILAATNEGRVTTVYWFIIIVIVDISIFVLMYYRRRKKKLQMLEEPETTVVKSSLAQFHRPVLPTQSAIYIFGGMRIFNRDGEDITKRFSPILKELLALLIVHSDKKGISGDKMKSYLWQDKTIASARNNRAVNLGKLRNLLSEVGDFEIKSDDGYWRIDTNEIFIDYLTYRSILKTPGILSKEDVEMLCVISSEGNILPEQQYEWLDNLKGTISDDIFDKFLGFAETLDEYHAADLYIGIADVMFKFESINEQALALKCRAYSRSGRHSAAKIFYDKFCEDYRAVYDEEFSISFADILKSTQNEIHVRTV